MCCFLIQAFRTSNTHTHTNLIKEYFEKEKNIFWFGSWKVTKICNKTNEMRVYKASTAGQSLIDELSNENDIVGVCSSDLTSTIYWFCEQVRT